MARRALDEAIHYASKRQQFGRLIAEHQLIQDKLADMVTELDAARLLVYRAAYLKDTSEARVTREASEFRVTVQSAFPLQLALESSERAAGGEWTLVDKQVATSMSTSFNDRPLTQAAFYRVRAESVQE